MRDFHVFMEKYRKEPYAVAYKNACSTKRALSHSQVRSMYERTGIEKHTSPANAITDQQKSSSVKDKFTLTELLFI